MVGIHSLILYATLIIISIVVLVLIIFYAISGIADKRKDIKALFIGMVANLVIAWFNFLFNCPTWLITIFGVTRR